MAHDHAPAHTSRKRLLAAITIIGTVFIAEVIGGIISGSLALLADAGHMLSDLIGLIIALSAMILATRPATAKATYGYRRTEVFGALINGLILCGVSVFITIEAIKRLTDPGEAEILPIPMLIVAIVGLGANVAAMLLLRSGAKTSINMRGAYLEVFGDMLGSVAVIVAAIIILFTQWAPADAIVSLAIAAFIIPRAFLLLRDVWRVLNESTPTEMSVEEVRVHIAKTEGVVEVHDVHLWSITSGEHVFTAHVVVEDAVFDRGDAGKMLDHLSDCLHDHFDVEHSTFQLEPVRHAEHEREVHV
ncbi:cation transporter [Mycetocola tolaasinivorans]|uniref:Cation transporter n=1 Tax=Mycetocola tolaasinivorans TaxID=76635 RepID=A0A3L7A8V1_9MICO|nr:cation diffusion facilitator family transporter [Mycetocola tolaasinivorans]RLP76494.1 cation transporter [Mycetocola tolaasinivorans]